MSYLKEQAIEILNSLNASGKIEYQQYSDLMDEVQEIELLRDRDEELRDLWDQFGDVPMNPETECIEEPFMGWGVGISREEIWHWFDSRYSKGVVSLLYGDGVDRTTDMARTAYMKCLCHDCYVEHCAFNPDGVCRFPLVAGCEPSINDDGCKNFVFKEG